jgi:hypothetical protein
METQLLIKIVHMSAVSLACVVILARAMTLFKGVQGNQPNPAGRTPKKLKFHDFWVSKRRLYKLQNSKAVRLLCKIRRINAAFIHSAEGFNLSAVIKILAKCFENNFNKTMDYRFNTHFFTSWVLCFSPL